MGTTTYLITGVNRGIGKGFLEAYLSRGNTTVIGGVRDPCSTASQALYKVPKDPSSSLILVKIDSASETDPAEAIKELQITHNITKLDVVIANAGILKIYPRVEHLKAADLNEHVLVNVLGPVYLFQAVLPLLNRAERPRFIAISSSSGIIGNMELAPSPRAHAAYGTSKAMVNYLMRKIHYEHENIIAFPVDPGWVQTDMGNSGAVHFGVPSGKADITIEQSIGGLLKIIDEATKEKSSGHFLMWSGREHSSW